MIQKRKDGRVQKSGINAGKNAGEKEGYRGSRKGKTGGQGDFPPEKVPACNKGVSCKTSDPYNPEYMAACLSGSCIAHRLSIGLQEGSAAPGIKGRQEAWNI